MNLWDLNVNDSGLVEEIKSSNTRNLSILNELGLAKDAVVRCLYKTLLGGPRVFEINGVVCTLCSQSAKQVLLKAS